MKTGTIVGIIVIIGIVYFLKRNNNSSIQFAEQITLGQLHAVMERLIEGKLEYGFFGITSNGTDCIYFTEHDKKINIEFEVMTDEQKPYLQKIENFAKEEGFKVSKTTYGNKPYYSELKVAPVYRIELNATKENATEVGISMMKTIFNNDMETVFDVVP